MALRQRIENSWVWAITFLVLTPIISCVTAYYAYAVWLGYSMPRSVFGSQVTVSEVLESKVHVTLFPKAECRYAIIRFDEVTAERLKTEGPQALAVEMQESWLKRIDWEETPISFNPYDGKRDPIYCLDNVNPKTKAEILSALNERGNFHAGDALGRIAILSATHRIAAIIHTR